MRVSGIAAGVALVLLIALAVRVWVAPVTIPSADRTVRTVLNQLAGDNGRVAVGGVSVGWSPERAFELVVREVALRGPAGSLEAPETIFDLSVRSLLTGDIRVHSISIVDPVLEVNLPTIGTGDGAADPAADDEADLPPPLGVLPVAEQRLARISLLARERGLAELHILNGEVHLPNLDPRLPDRRFTSIDASFRPDRDGDVAIEAIGQADSGSWRVTVDRSSAGSGSELVARASGLTLTDFIDIPLIRSGFHMAPTLTAWFGPSGRLDQARIELSVEQGVFQIAKDPARSIDRLTVAATWSATTRAVTVGTLELAAGATYMSGHGRFVPPSGPDGAWTYELQADDARIGPDDVDGPPLDFVELSTAGEVRPERSYVTFDRFVARSTLGSITGAGSMDFGPQGPSLAAALKTSPMSASALMRMWPVVLGYEARSWLVGNVLAGQIERADMQFALLPLDMDGKPATASGMDRTIDIDIAYSGAALKLPGELPALMNAEGTATVVDRHVTLNAETAELRPDGRDPIAVEGFYADVPSVTSSPPIGTIRSRLSGPAPSIAALAAAKPIDALRFVDVTPDDLTGSIAANLEAVGPLGNTIEPDALKWSVDATLTDVASAVAINGQTVTDADLNVVADQSSATVKGDATVDGVRASIDFTQTFSGDDQGRSGDVSFVLTDAERKKRGFETGSFLKGPIEVSMEETAEGERRIEASLTRAQVTIPGFGWTKSAGVPATAAFTLVEQDGRTEVNYLKITSDGLDIQGGVRLEGGKLVDATFDRFALRATDKAQLKVTPSGNGYDIRLSGSAFDGRGVISGLKNGSDGGGGSFDAPINVTIALDAVQGNGGVTLTGVNGAVRMTGGRLASLDLTGSTNGGRATDLVAKVAPSGGGTRSLSVRSGDTGQLLKFLDLYQRLAGGQGILQATLRRNGPTNGQVRIEQFRITGDPAVENLIDRTVQTRRSAGSRVMAYQPEPQQRPNNSFEELVVPFTESDGRVEISDAILRGAAIGGTAGGVIDLDNRTLQISGTAIPAYAVNNLFGRVPVLGEILGGGKEGGLFGVTFRLDGPMSGPNLSFNPLSAVTPGIFRRIFEQQNADGVPSYQGYNNGNRRN
ncbi:hypothetical protein J2S73_004189 [Amorphus orientalis]|uniref:DUF3971 domain-containing protein n=2 Tax=Amorphus orientalis TaxID=649198 RepID=A0AAE3VTU5_9HYPH|nr:hypothetical protein [Amorphus orientalis]